jgi:hypothetical protein
MLFLLLLLCNIVWSQVLWYLQHCSFCWDPWIHNFSNQTSDSRLSINSDGIQSHWILWNSSL